MKPRSKYVKLQHLIPEVMQMRAEGLSLQVIGDRLKLSKQRVSQVTQAARRLEQIQAKWGWPFSTRTNNIVERLAIRDRDHALELYNSGHLHPQSVTGFGVCSYHEICEWLGVPVLKRRPEPKKTCPHCGKEI
jgi:hypothetical protein